MPGEHGYTQPARVGPGAASQPARGQRLDTESELAIEQEAKIALELQEYRGNGAGEDDTKTRVGTVKLLQRGLAQPGPLSAFRWHRHRPGQSIAGAKGRARHRPCLCGRLPGRALSVPARDGDDGLPPTEGPEERGPRIHRLRSISAEPIRDYRDHRRSRLRSSHPRPFQPGTYILFAVLCGAASYIAVPAVQRLAIPEASPTLPLAASLGLTFSYNVTIGIPVYIEISRAVTPWFDLTRESLRSK